MTVARSAPSLSDDLLQPFQLDELDVGGRLARLGPVVDKVLHWHEYPEPVSKILGELVVLASLLAGALKSAEVFSLQTRSDGPIDLMVVDVDPPGALRAYARFDTAKLDAVADEKDVGPPSVPRLLGAGHLAFTIDRGPDAGIYQGVVGLEGATLAECAHAYFNQSEQLATGIRLAVGKVLDSRGRERWRAGGIMVQRMPGAGAGSFAEEYDQDERAEEWHEALALMGHVRDDDLLDPATDSDRLLYRLFHAHGPRVFRQAALKAGCRCSRRSVGAVLASFPRIEVEEMADDGQLTVTCQFCNRSYVFALDDVAAVAVASARPVEVLEVTGPGHASRQRS